MKSYGQRSVLCTINLVLFANFFIWHRVWEKWEKLEPHEKEERVIVHHQDAVFFQYSAFTWVHQRSPVFGEIRHGQAIVVLMKEIRVTGATEVVPVWNRPTSHRTLLVGPLEGRTASPRLDHTLVAPEMNGSQPANGVRTIYQLS